jgi:structure-specific recognition protein 1
MVLIHLPIIPISGNMLSFNVGSKEAFEVSLADVSQTQLQGKTDVVLEFHVDDTTGANEVCGYVDPKLLVVL